MNQPVVSPVESIATLQMLAEHSDNSLRRYLNPDPDATPDGRDHAAREVFQGHYVPVQPTPIADPEYVAHSSALFAELGLSETLVQDPKFQRFFSGDWSVAPASLGKAGWACGYALSIFGREYQQQCPFGTGNGYGDGRAISVLEAVLGGKRWEMQLKGGGRTPYCRGGDGRAVLRSSVREFLAQEHMHALGVPTSRSLSLFVSKAERVRRPWYEPDSDSFDPDTMVLDPVAICTRVAPSFIRVGQLELFARRARSQTHPQALQELRMMVEHAMAREYAESIDAGLSFEQCVLAFARQFGQRLAQLVAHWIRVGYCQGNFNSDNCAVGGFTLDYGPFGFCEAFDPYFQSWTGGGRHFSFLVQPKAAEQNFKTFCSALRPLLAASPAQLEELADIESSFADAAGQVLAHMWAAKLGLSALDPDLFDELIALMMQTPVDYTVFFRELSGVPGTIEPLMRSFYAQTRDGLEPLTGGSAAQASAGRSLGQSATGSPLRTQSGALVDDARWTAWLQAWRSAVGVGSNPSPEARAQLSETMKRVNPKYTWREWLIAPAYEQAKRGDYALIHALQKVLSDPYSEQTAEVESRYYQLRPAEYFQRGGISHYSCSS